ncbi:hypothetical protein KKA14_08615 [bacterium]|nr:hypothetical protein [bacterium]
MALLSEYAICPCLFNSQSYSSEEVGRLQLQFLKEAFLTDSIIRNLCNGGWFQFVLKNSTSWHVRSKELLKKIKSQGRLRNFENVLNANPEGDTDWCAEALASNEREALSGIITNSELKGDFDQYQLIASIDKLSSTSWWQQRSQSVRLNRSIEEYINHLKLILQASNSVMFIDPHLDPTKPKYRGFEKFLEIIGTQKIKPLIEIHRVCYFGSGQHRNIISDKEWKQKFNDSFLELIKRLGLNVKVFIWDDFHDRYLISNLVGLNIPYGFDTTTNPQTKTTWTRLSRQNSDDIQREFEENTGAHTLQTRFTIS